LAWLGDYLEESFESEEEEDHMINPHQSLDRRILMVFGSDFLSSNSGFSHSWLAWLTWAAPSAAPWIKALQNYAGRPIS